MKKTNWLAILATVFMVSSALPDDEPVVIHNGFATGEQFLRMPEPEKHAFAMGTINGMFLAPMLGAPKERLLRFERCLEDMTGSQVAAILEKYLRDRPERWHETPHVPMYAALSAACPQ